jgi:PncC family amidohydrolase
MRLEEEAGHVLRMNGLTLALAESCTGGLIASMITDVPGSSEYFMASLVTYDNSSKIALLGVSPDTLAGHGAVSEQIAREMALGARRAAGADIGLAVTGIAGPGGGTPGKPVGTVHFALCDCRTTITS